MLSSINIIQHETWPKIIYSDIINPMMLDISNPMMLKEVIRIPLKIGK